MKVTTEEIKFIVRCVLDYLAEKRATFEPTGIAFHYPGMSVMKRVTVYVNREIGNSQYIEDFIDHIVDIIYTDYGGDK